MFIVYFYSLLIWSWVIYFLDGVCNLCCYIRCWRFSFGVRGGEGDAVLGDRAEQSVMVRRRPSGASLLFFLSPGLLLGSFLFLDVVLVLLFLLFL